MWGDIWAAVQAIILVVIVGAIWVAIPILGTLLAIVAAAFLMHAFIKMSDSDDEDDKQS